MRFDLIKNPEHLINPLTLKEKLVLLFQKIWRRLKLIGDYDRIRVMKYQKRYQAPHIEMGDYSYGHPSGSPEIIYFGEENVKLKVGKFCSIAERVTIFLGGYHRSDWVSTYPFGVVFKGMKHTGEIHKPKGDIIIGNDVWIGAGATILSGVTIGNGAIIATNSVVTKNVEDYAIMGGNPAKELKKRFLQEDIISLLAIKWWDWDIEKIISEDNYFQTDNIKEFIIRHK